jgi:hypothetical protein
MSSESLKSKMAKAPKSKALAALILFGFFGSSICLANDQLSAKPNSQVKVAGVKEHAQRVVRVLYSQDNAKIVLLGSSLVQMASMAADCKFENNSLWQNWTNYNDCAENHTHASHFEHVIKDTLGQDVSVFNLGEPSAVIEDDCLILEKLIKFKKKPRIVVLGIAPRDFIVNQNVDNESPIHHVLHSYDPPSFPLALGGDQLSVLVRALDLSHTITSLDWIRSSRDAFATSMTADIGRVRQSVLNTRPRSTDLAAAPPASTTASSTTTDSVKDKSVSVNSTSALTSATAQTNKSAARAAGLQAPRITDYKTPRDYLCAPVTLADMQGVEFALSEQSRPYLCQQLQALVRLLALAKKESISLYVVKMPLSGPLTEKIRDSYLQPIYGRDIPDLCKRYGATTFSLDDKASWPLAYFHDSAHMNSDGGHHFFTELVKRLAEDDTFRTAINPGTRSSRFASSVNAVTQ